MPDRPPRLITGRDPLPFDPDDVHVVMSYDGTIIRTIPIPRPVIDAEVLSRITAGVRRAFDGVKEAMQPFATALSSAGRKIAALLVQMETAANDPVRIAGLCARFQVRAGLDPAYATPASIDALVRSILDREADTALILVRADNRRLIAVAAMRGWAESYDTGRPVVIRHALVGTTAVEVRCG